MWVQRDYRAISGVDPGDCRVTVLGRSGDRRGHGNRMLNNEQQVFTLDVNLGNTEEKLITDSGIAGGLAVSKGW